MGRFFGGGAFGLRIDYCHDKVYAKTNLTPSLQRFSLSHGLNSITADALVRRRWTTFAVYIGAGVGTIVPHVEAVAAGGSVDGYQWFRGVAAKAVAGVTVEVAGPLAVFAELRLTYVHAAVSVPEGDARASFLAEHAAAGALFRL